MRSALTIAKRELYVYFTTPLAYGVFTAVAFLEAQFFNGALDRYVRQVSTVFPTEQAEVLAHTNLTDAVISPVLGSTAFFIIVAIPFLSMRLIAGEKRGHTFTLLATAPMRPYEIVLGKYLAALAVVAVAIGIVALFPFLLHLMRDTSGAGWLGSDAPVEWQTAATGLLGLFLLGAMAMAVGLFVSATTDSAIVAALATLLVLMSLWFAEQVAGGVEGPAKELMATLSIPNHLSSFVTGRIELRDLVYWLSFVLIGLFLTERTLAAHQWK
jgi:ABC-2 type transport system permease protein